MQFSSAPLGDRAVMITLGATIDQATHRRVRAVCARLDERPAPGMIEYVPAFTSVVVHYDPARVGEGDGSHPAAPYTRMVAALDELLVGVEEGASLPAPTVEIPVCYGGELGPDLDEVARVHGLSADDVIRMHTEGDYLVYMVGFMPGFAYLGGLPEVLVTPRRAVPRTRVPAGAVGIGGSQTGVYPMESPGGWNLIGRTPRQIFLPAQEPPTLLRMGDHVRFHAISREQFDEWIELSPA